MTTILAVVNERFDQVNTRLDTMNGRVRAVETFKERFTTVGVLALFAFANVGAWIALVK